MSSLKMIPYGWVGNRYVLVKIPVELWEEIDELVELEKLEYNSLEEIVERALKEFLKK